MYYLTPSRYRTMGFGADVDDTGDDALSMQLRLASTLVNRYCNRPRTYDFRGGVIEDEPHAWRMGNYMWPGSRTLFPDHKPLIELSTFKIYVTNTQYLDVGLHYVHYDRSRNALEPVIAATSIGIWSYTAIPVAGFLEPQARIGYTYGYTFPVTDEEIFTVGAGVFQAANQWWTDDDVVLYKNGAEVDTADYTVDRDEGTVTLDETYNDTVVFDDIFTLDYAHRLPEEVRDATAVITTDLLGAANIVGAGLLGLSGIKAEEIELRQSRDTRVVAGEISDRAKVLLDAYREIHWG